MKKKVTMKDLVYWIIMLILLNIFIITGRLSDNTTVLSYISFSGTLISIILAVIAIIYSYFQSSSFENMKTKLDDSVEKIQSATNDLESISQLSELTNKVSDSICNFEHNISNSLQGIEKYIDELSFAIDTGISNLSQEVGGKVSNVHSSIEEYNRNIKDLILKKKPSISVSSDEEVFYEFSLLESGVFDRTIIILYSFYLLQNQPEKDLHDVSHWLYDNGFSFSEQDDTEELGKEKTYSYYFGMLEVYFNLGVFEVDDNAKINNFDNLLLSELQNRIAENEDINSNVLNLTKYMGN